jgi:hypothetical protein
MSGPFIELTETRTSRAMPIDADRVISVAPHGRGGSCVFLTGCPDRIAVDETPGRVSEILQSAAVMYAQGELQE